VNTLDEIMTIAETVLRQRSTFALFEMREVLQVEAHTPHHGRRLRVINDELRSRKALPPRSTQ
jgi:hypothetical protein